MLHTPTPLITRPKISAVIFGAAPYMMEPMTKSNENFQGQNLEVEEPHRKSANRDVQDLGVEGRKKLSIN